MFGNIAFTVTKDRLGYDFRELINLKFLILWRVRIIKNPLLKRDVSTNKVKKLRNNFILVLN